MRLLRAARLAEAATVGRPLAYEPQLVAALALLDAERPREALPFARRAAHLAPDQPMVLYALERALSGEGHVDAARIALRNAKTAASRLPPDQRIEEGDGLTARALLAGLSAHDR